MPSPELLRELQNRLLEQPKCRPECAASPRLTLEVGTTTLRARMEVDAAAVTAIPLPGAADQWLPERVLLDGEPARALQRSNDGTLWLALSPGKHQVLMEGGLPERALRKAEDAVDKRHQRAPRDRVGVPAGKAKGQ